MFEVYEEFLASIHDLLKTLYGSFAVFCVGFLFRFLFLVLFHDNAIVLFSFSVNECFDRNSGHDYEVC